MPLEGWSVPLGPRVGIEPTSEPEPKFRLDQPDRRDRYGREVSRSPCHIEKREILCRVRHGAGGGIQTPDNLSTKQKLYQLSYTSRFEWAVWHPPTLTG